MNEASGELSCVCSGEEGGHKGNGLGNISWCTDLCTCCLDVDHHVCFNGSWSEHDDRKISCLLHFDADILHLAHESRLGNRISRKGWIGVRAATTGKHYNPAKTALTYHGKGCLE